MSPGASCAYGFVLTNSDSRRRGKNNIIGNHSQVGKHPEGGMRPERTAGRKKRGKAGTSGASHAGKTTLQVYNALQCWWVERGE
jgi:hypothetical protein